MMMIMIMMIDNGDDDHTLSLTVFLVHDLMDSVDNFPYLHTFALMIMIMMMMMMMMIVMIIIMIVMMIVMMIVIMVPNPSRTVT